MKPDVYQDSTEIFWKNEVAQAYYSILALIEEIDQYANPLISELIIRFINTFNSNHALETFCPRVNAIQVQLYFQLREQGHEATVESISDTINQAKERVEIGLHSFFTPTSDLEDSFLQSRITEGQIKIAGLSMEEFASIPDYYDAILKLFDVPDSSYKELAEAAFLDGGRLNQEEVGLIEKAKARHWESVDTVTYILLNYQTENKSSSLQILEETPSNTDSFNDQHKKTAIIEAFYLIGKTLATVALYGSQFNTYPIHEISPDPIETFLVMAGRKATPQELTAIRKIALAHSSHGLNSGELTAMIAGSVRTSFPRALIASLNIRSGIVHAGALTECMHQTQEYLLLQEEPDLFVQNVLSNRGKLYGFGHRIHKTSPQDPVELLGKDPRVAWYIQSVREGFPDKEDIINRLVAYASSVRKIRPDLGANTDFGASVLFHCLDLSPQVAAGFFTAFRIPGLCARIVNELSVKSNSRRPPFPTVLSYRDIR